MSEARSTPEDYGMITEDLFMAAINRVWQEKKKDAKIDDVANFLIEQYGYQDIDGLSKYLANQFPDWVDTVELDEVVFTTPEITKDEPQIIVSKAPSEDSLPGAISELEQINQKMVSLIQQNGGGASYSEINPSVEKLDEGVIDNKNTKPEKVSNPAEQTGLPSKFDTLISSITPSVKNTSGITPVITHEQIGSTTGTKSVDENIRVNSKSFSEMTDAEFKAVNPDKFAWDKRRDYVQEQIKRTALNSDGTKKDSPALKEIAEMQNLPESKRESSAMRALNTISDEITERVKSISSENVTEFVRCTGKAYKDIPIKQRVAFSILLSGTAVGLSFTGFYAAALVPALIMQRGLAGSATFILLEATLKKKKETPGSEEKWYNKHATAIAAGTGFVLGSGILGKLFQAGGDTVLKASSYIGSKVLGFFAGHSDSINNTPKLEIGSATPKNEASGIVTHKATPFSNAGDKTTPINSLITPKTATPESLPTSNTVVESQISKPEISSTPIETKSDTNVAIVTENATAPQKVFTPEIAIVPEKIAPVSLEIVEKSSIWRTLANHIKDNPEKFNFTGTEAEKGAWVQRQVANILSKNPDVAQYNIVHPGDEIEVSVGEDGAVNLKFENTSGIEPAVLSADDTPKLAPAEVAKVPGAIAPEASTDAGSAGTEPQTTVTDTKKLDAAPAEGGTAIGSESADPEPKEPSDSSGAPAPEPADGANGKESVSPEKTGEPKTETTPTDTGTNIAGTPDKPVTFSPEQLAKARDVLSNEHLQKQINALFPPKKGFMDMFSSLFSTPTAPLAEPKDWLAIKDTTVETLLNNSLADPSKAGDPDFVKMREYIKSVIAQTNVNPNPTDTAEQYLKSLSDMWAKGEMTRLNNVTV